jgi:hypothetical protein
MAQRDRPAVGVHSRVVVGDPELAKDRETLRGERLIQFDHGEVGDLEAEALHQFSRRRRRADPMIRGGTPATAPPSTRARGVRPLRLAASSLAMTIAAAPSLTPEALPAVTVPSAERSGFSLASASRLVCARMLVLVDDEGIALPLRNLDRDDFPRPAGRSPGPLQLCPGSAGRRHPGPRG